MVLHSMVSKDTNKIPHHMALQEVTVDRPLPLAMNNSLVVTVARLVATVVVVVEVVVVVTMVGHKEVVALMAVGEDQVDTGVLVDPTAVVGEEEGVTVEEEEEEAVEVVAEMAEEEEDTEVEVVVVEGTAEVLVVVTEVETEEVLVK